MTTITKQFHWFVTSPFHYLSGHDLFRLLSELRSADKRAGLMGNKKDYWGAVNVWRVPGDLETPYEVEWYEPQVEGALYCGSADLAGGLEMTVREKSRSKK